MGGVSSDGVRIERATSGDHGAVHQRNLFTDAAGNAVGGTVTISSYLWQENGGGTGTYMNFDRIGANLTVDNGSFELQGRDSAMDDDVNMVWIRSGQTLNTTAGSILVNDAFAASTGRMGFYFPGAGIDSNADLSILGPNTFLNDGGSAATINVAGNLTVESWNPQGFSTINSLTGGLTVDADNFDLRASTITMDGSGASAITWDTSGADKTPGDVTAADFGTANFTLDTLAITNSTAVTVDGDLFLDSDLIIDAGSTLAFADMSANVHLLDLDLSEVARIQGYIDAGLILGPYTNIRLATDGFSITPVPEPASCLLMGLALAALARRQR